MKKQFYAIFIVLVLALVIGACAPSTGSESEVPSSEDQVATIVAGTMQALTPTVSEATPEPTESAGLLPHSFYYIGTDNATGLSQVFYIEQDGTTTHQITFEPVNVDSYDVSLVDGSVVFVSNNQLLWVDVNGSGRRLLVDGGPLDPNNPILNSLTSPVYSPDESSSRRIVVVLPAPLGPK
jgi:hypothetical protein